MRLTPTVFALQTASALMIYMNKVAFSLLYQRQLVHPSMFTFRTPCLAAMVEMYQQLNPIAPSSASCYQAQKVAQMTKKNLFHSLMLSVAFTASTCSSISLNTSLFSRIMGLFMLKVWAVLRRVITLDLVWLRVLLALFLWVSRRH